MDLFTVCFANKHLYVAHWTNGIKPTELQANRNFLLINFCAWCLCYKARRKSKLQNETAKWDDMCL
jgi:hypothetical protein